MGCGEAVFGYPGKQCAMNEVAMASGRCIIICLFTKSVLWNAVHQMYEESGWLQETSLSELYKSLNRSLHYAHCDFHFHIGIHTANGVKILNTCL